MPDCLKCGNDMWRVMDNPPRFTSLGVGTANKSIAMTTNPSAANGCTKMPRAYCGEGEFQSVF